jgi:hypothetical protein
MSSNSLVRERQQLAHLRHGCRPDNYLGSVGRVESLIVGVLIEIRWRGADLFSADNLGHAVDNRRCDGMKYRLHGALPTFTSLRSTGDKIAR